LPTAPVCGDEAKKGVNVAKLRLDISMSLDGFVAGPNPTLEQPLGEHGERLHDWITRLSSWREQHGLMGGESNADAEVVSESIGTTGAVVMGRRMFSGGAGAWEDDPRADGWWGEEPPFRAPVFVVTHHAREPLPRQGGTTYTFVTEGIEAALEQAREAAGENDVLLAGGASVAQQYLTAGLLDEVQIHVVPVFLGAGVRLFDGIEPNAAELRPTRVIDSPAVTHLRYSVERPVP
jgi:dihydrofolate reductase